MKSFQSEVQEEAKKLFKVFDYLVWALFDPSKFTLINKKYIKNILIINTGSIGELLLCCPMFKALRKEFNADISIMVRERLMPVLENNPNIKEILPYKQFNENVSELEKRNFDLAIIVFPGTFKNAYMCIKAGIKYRIGCYKYVRDGLSLGYTRRIFPINKKNVMEYYFNMVKLVRADLEKEQIRNEIYLTKKEKDWAKRFLKKNKIKKYAVIHPGFSSATKTDYPSRKWPYERYGQVIDYLIEKYKLNIIMTGSKAEEFISQEIKKLVKTKNQKKVLICPDFTIRENFAVIEKAEILIEASTGMGHCAATALNTKVISMAGKTDENEWKPWGDENKIRYLYHNEVCTGCNREFCRKKTTECLSAISVDEVKQAIDELLKKAKK